MDENRSPRTISTMVLHSPEVPDEIPVPAESLFLGSLRSELDVPDTLPPNFTRFKDTYGLLMQIYRSGQVTAEQLADMLSRLKCKDQSEGEWTIGGSSGKWYRRLSGRWVVSGPPLSIAGDAVPGTWEAVETQVRELSGTPYTPPVATPAEPEPEPELDDLTNFFMPAPAPQPAAQQPTTPLPAATPEPAEPAPVPVPAETPPLPVMQTPPPPPDDDGVSEDMFEFFMPSTDPTPSTDPSQVDEDPDDDLLGLAKPRPQV